jgi:hypothetical protein
MLPDRRRSVAGWEPSVKHLQYAEQHRVLDQVDAFFWGEIDFAGLWQPSTTSV